MTPPLAPGMPGIAPECGAECDLGGERCGPSGDPAAQLTQEDLPVCLGLLVRTIEPLNVE